jgi:CheY-like chemotaxis protein
MEEPRPLGGLRVLVAEDNMLAAMMLEQVLTGLGCELVGPAARFEDALRLAREERLDGAIVDVDLRGIMVFPVAEELVRRSVPVIFATGYGAGQVFPEDFRSHPRLTKPYLEDDIKRLALATFATTEDS